MFTELDYADQMHGEEIAEREQPNADEERTH